jgi:hypothetical protein
MMLRRLSILGSLLLAACVPNYVPPLQPSGYYNRVATKEETAAWRAALRINTASAYRTFIHNYPRSRYVPAATAKLSAIVNKQQPIIRNVFGGRESNGGGSRGGY